MSHHYLPKPHVSQAVKQLRRWVTLCASVLALCCISQMLVFGFARYTDARWVEQRLGRVAPSPLTVVGGPEGPVASAPTATQIRTSAAIPEPAATASTTVPATTPETSEPQHVELLPTSDGHLPLVGSDGLLSAGLPSGDAEPVKPRQAKPASTVQQTPAPEPVRTATSAAPSTPALIQGGVRATLAAEPAPTVKRSLSATDAIMSRTSQFASATGVIAAVVLAVMCFLGAVVAGGSSVPGVERVVTASVWSVVLALLALPWTHVLPGLGVPGIFASYVQLCGAIDSMDAGAPIMGELGMLGQWIIGPVVAMFVSLGVILWFRAGVERGVIITSPSQLDRAVEREVDQISKRGVQASAPKSVGALHRAIGDGVGDDSPAHAIPVPAMAGAAAALSATHDGPITRVRAPRGVADDDFKRPI